MKISELIVFLQQAQEKYGDIPVMWQGISHAFPVDAPKVRDLLGERVAVIINP